MSAETFLKHVEALATKRLEKPKKLSSQNNEYWSEIESQQYNFDRGLYNNNNCPLVVNVLTKTVLYFSVKAVFVTIYRQHRGCTLAQVDKVRRSPVLSNVHRARLAAAKQARRARVVITG